MRYIPKFDPNYNPAYIALNEFYKNSTHTIKVAVERENGLIYVKEIPVNDDLNESYFYVERIVKSILWLVGGYKVYVSNKDIYELLNKDYSATGIRVFDYHFVSKVYEKPFELVYTPIEDFPKELTQNVKCGGHTNGCRIGFDAGGSDRKVSAMKDGEVVYSEEVIWFPKITKDYKYHYEEILKAFKTAASYLPRVDAIGVSSAGIYINNRTMVASLFMSINGEDFEKHIKDIYINVAKEIGDVPLVVANDGDVTALAGAMELNDNCVLGIAMGTSEAAGYINKDGCLNGWLNELAFVPVDFNKDAMIDEWSTDYGCGVKYFSQDGVIKLAEVAGIELSGSPAEKLKKVQELCVENHPDALQIFKDIGIYLGYAIGYYSMYYDIKYLLILGRVTSGIGGSLIIEYATKVLEELNLNVKLVTPDEKNKRLGQSVVAATLPEL